MIANERGVFSMEFARVTPESLGIPSQAILDLLDELYRYGIERFKKYLKR